MPRRETFLAAGCGANTALFPAAMRLMALFTVVGTGWVEGVTAANDAEGRQLDNGQSAVTRPGNRFQVFHARREPGDDVEFPDFMGNSAHAGFVDGHLCEALGVLQGRLPNGLDDSPPGFERKGFQTPAAQRQPRRPRGPSCSKMPFVPVSGRPSRRTGRPRAPASQAPGFERLPQQPT